MRTAAFVLAPAALLAASCSAPERAATMTDQLPARGFAVQPPDQSLFLRASFDEDPGTFIGRFVPDGLARTELDENRAAKTRCSEHIKFKVINASGPYDETFQISTQISARLGVFPVAGASGSGSSSTAMRVKYDLAKKMRAEVADPAALDRCCKAAPDQCSALYIGEFYFGTGQVFQAIGSKAEVEASGIAQTVSGAVDFKDEVAWKRATEFKDTYFAFRTAATSLGTGLSVAAADDCSWAARVPSSLDGKYFVGVSAHAVSEGQARDLAMRNAREQVVKFVGEYLTSSMKTKAHAVEGYLEDEQVITAVAQGLVSRVKDERWCPAEKNPTPKGEMYTVKVLAFLPEAEKAGAAKGAMDAMLGALKAKGKLKPDEERELRGLAGALK